MAKNLYTILQTCQTEEEVKSEFARYFKFKIDTKDRIDHYTKEILYEFKHNMELSKPQQRARCIAQTLYYIRFLKYGTTTRVVSPFIAIVDKNEGLFVETSKYHTIFTNEYKYDWDRRPSSPCPKVIEAVAKNKETTGAHVYDFSSPSELQLFIDRLQVLSSTQTSLFDSEKKEINEENFMEIYEHWESMFGEYVKNGHKPSEYFLTDMQEGRAFRKDKESNKVVFELNDGEAKIKSIPIKDYEYFWETYGRTSDQKVIYSIRQKMDRLTEDYRRRFTGEFFTPIEFAQKGLKYIEKVVGKQWWESGEYRLWDMAAGTGNLEFELPTSALKYCYISTLIEDDAKYCSRIFPNATCFQYDYLNDDVEVFENPLLRGKTKLKIPQNLQDDLNNPDIKWIVLINPPFAMSSSSGREVGRKSKENVSFTRIQKLMEQNDLGEVSRELFSQFIYRLSLEFADRKCYLSLFSKLKYINSNNDQKLRDSVFQYVFKKGFMFPSKSFVGAKGSFPVGFLVWDMGSKKTVEKQEVVLDVFDLDACKYGRKRIVSTDRGELLNKWPHRPPAREVMPPLKSAITVADGHKDVRDRVAQGFLASLMCHGNDIGNQNYTALLSSPSASAGAFSVVEENFERAMMLHAVRRLPKQDWTCDRDQYYQPTNPVGDEFISDCVIWTAFSDSNNTVSMKDVEYKGKVYQVHNQMYPFPLKTVKQWHCHIDEIETQIFAENEERFLAKWIGGHSLSPEAKELYRAGRELYKEFYSVLHETTWLDYKIGLWDVGYYQVKRVIEDTGDRNDNLKKVKELHRRLGEKLLPQVYEHGFLPDPVQLLD